jgi:hypothetical protein
MLIAGELFQLDSNSLLVMAPKQNPYKKAKDLWSRICPPHRNHLERVDLESFKKEMMDHIWKLFDPNEGEIITRTMFKKSKALRCVLSHCAACYFV